MHFKNMKSIAAPIRDLVVNRSMVQVAGKAIGNVRKGIQS